MALRGRTEPKLSPAHVGARQGPSPPTPFSVGSPPKFSSTYQSDSHSQCGEGSATPSSGRCWSPLTSLHGQRSLGSSFSQKPPTGFQRWGPQADVGFRPAAGPPPASPHGGSEPAWRSGTGPKGQRPYPWAQCFGGQAVEGMAILGEDTAGALAPRTLCRTGQESGVQGLCFQPTPPPTHRPPPDSHRPPLGGGWGHHWHTRTRRPGCHRRCPSSTAWLH